MSDPKRSYARALRARGATWLPGLIFVSVLGASWGCEDQASPIEPSTTSIEVTTSTEGEGQSIEPYTVLLNRSPSGKVGTNGTVTLSFVPRGTYLIGLDGIPENCRSVSDPRQITVDPDHVSYVTFLVKCSLED